MRRHDIILRINNIGTLFFYYYFVRTESLVMLVGFFFRKTNGMITNLKIHSVIHNRQPIFISVIKEQETLNCKRIERVKLRMMM